MATKSDARQVMEVSVFKSHLKESSASATSPRLPLELYSRNITSALRTLPLFCREEASKVVRFDPHNLQHLTQELGLRRLKQLEAFLSIAGRPVPPMPLHRHVLLGRRILITEQIDLHLVWSTKPLDVFLKPLPLYLLDGAFWEKYLLCRDRICSCGCIGDRKDETASLCQRQSLLRDVFGFLSSYTAMLMYQTDFDLAKEHHLIPHELEWDDWRCLIDRIEDVGHSFTPGLSPRFKYGELRLSRLNMMYRILPNLNDRTVSKAFFHRQREYAGFFNAHFGWLFASTAYIVVVLTAMQVGLATQELSNNHIFQRVSSGFTIFAILFPIAIACIVIVAFTVLFCKDIFSARAMWNEAFGKVNDHYS